MEYTTNRTVDRAIEILALIASNNEEGLIFSDIVRELEIPKGSLHPILGSLCNKRFLHYNEKEKRYFLGEELFNLGNSFIDKSNILILVEEELAKLSDETGYITFFGVLSGNEVMYLLRRIGSGNMTVIAAPQHNLKAHCTGLGKALLMDKSKSELFEMFKNGLPKVTQNTITDINVLYEQIYEMRRRGFGYEKEESSQHIQCISVPIRYNDKIVAATSVSFPAFGIEEEQIRKIEQCISVTKKAIERIIANNIRKWIYSDIR